MVLPLIFVVIKLQNDIQPVNVRTAWRKREIPKLKSVEQNSQLSSFQFGFIRTTVCCTTTTTTINGDVIAQQN